MWGLPELARFFIVSLEIEPEGTIYKHCNPPNISGLYLPPISEKNDWSKEGWDKSYLYGNCVFMRLDFWSSRYVQDFVRLCLDSGGTTRHRWNEQGVYAMVWQVWNESIN